MKKAGILTEGQRKRTIQTIRNIKARKKELVPPKWRWNVSEVENHIKNNFFVTNDEWNEILKEV